MGKIRYNFDPLNYPDQRANWDNLNRAQKAYTIRQYNKARQNKGLNSINNPFSKNDNLMGNPIVINDDGTETITPRTQPKLPYVLRKQQEREQRELEEKEIKEITELFKDPSFIKQFEKANQDNFTDQIEKPITEDPQPETSTQNIETMSSSAGKRQQSPNWTVPHAVLGLI